MPTNKAETRSFHPYEPYIPEGVTKLIVGTIPPWRFCKPQNESEELHESDVRFYYGSCDNAFWQLIVETTNAPKPIRKNTDVAIQQRQCLLNKLKIGITDIVESCIHEKQKSDDDSLKDIECKKLGDLLAKHPNINTLLYTSGFVTKQVNKIADIGEHRKWTDGRKKGTVTINGKEYKVIVLYSPSPNALRSITAEDRIKQYREVFGKRKTIYFAAQLETNPAVKSLFAVLKTHDVPFDFIKSTKDTWVRDFMPIQTKSGAWVSFRYEPSYHDTQAEIAKRTNYKRDINEQFSQFDITYSILNLDGGNIVFSPSKNKAIISDRIFIENKARTPKNLVRELEWRLETQVIIIPALKSDITGHADGMMRFVNENTVVVNKTNYENGLEQKIKKVLQSHGIEVIDFPYFDSKGDSAVGSYINFLETEQFIFLPVFDHDMDDEAITTAERLFDKQIIPVNINEIAENGGVLNCISWEQ